MLSGTLNSRTLNSRTLNSGTLDSGTLDSDTLNCATLNFIHFESLTMDIILFGKSLSFSSSSHARVRHVCLPLSSLQPLRGFKVIFFGFWEVVEYKFKLVQVSDQKEYNLESKDSRFFEDSLGCCGLVYIIL